MKYFVAYILLLILVIGLPVAVLMAPWNIDWAYWMQLEVPAWKAAWFALACVLTMGAYQMVRERRPRLTEN